jgi:hypothetical protein
MGLLALGARAVVAGAEPLAQPEEGERVSGNALTLALALRRSSSACGPAD